ncbi:MAG TPA: hypothetical protein VIK41_17665 [Gemmatimonadaceae bacterium]
MTRSTRWAATLHVIRVFLAITFATYGLVKVLGGQYNYGDWVIDKKTVDGTSLVWAFYGYSPMYGRFTGLFELVPAILLLIPRTATIGAAALFAVALNVTAMDFGFHYPAVKYFALGYTVLLAVLLWADREKLSLLLLSREQARVVAASPPTLSAEASQPLFSPVMRRVLLTAAGLFIIGAANVAALSISKGPEPVARRAVEGRMQPNERLELLRSRQTGLIGVDWTATVDYAVIGAQSTDTLTVHARKITALFPWRVTAITSTRRSQ